MEPNNEDLKRWLEDLDDEDFDFEHPRGTLREVLKQKLREGPDPRKNRFFPTDIIPVRASINRGGYTLSTDPIWDLVEPDEIREMWREIDHENAVRKLLAEKKALDTVAGFGRRLKNLCIRIFLWMMSWLVRDEKNDSTLKLLLESKGGIKISPSGTQYVDPVEILERRLEEYEAKIKKKE